MVPRVCSHVQGHGRRRGCIIIGAHDGFGGAEHVQVGAARVPGAAGGAGALDGRLQGQARLQALPGRCGEHTCDTSLAIYTAIYCNSILAQALLHNCTQRQRPLDIHKECLRPHLHSYHASLLREVAFCQGTRACSLCQSREDEGA